MNKIDTINLITESVRRKHPHTIWEIQYKNLFQELPKEYIEEKLILENFLKKANQFKSCVVSDEIYNARLYIKLNIDELIKWELSLDRWKESVEFHNVLPSDIKKILKGND